MEQYTVEVQENENNEQFIQFPDELIKQLDWKEGDTLTWKDNGDGSFSIAKQETEWVLVEAVSTFRKRYMVEVPKGKAEWALDTVACDDAEEFSQEYLGENIVSHRVVTEAEALQMCDADNAYCSTWGSQQKKDVFFTTIKDQNEAD